MCDIGASRTEKLEQFESHAQSCLRVTKTKPERELERRERREGIKLCGRFGTCSPPLCVVVSCLQARRKLRPTRVEVGTTVRNWARLRGTSPTYNGAETYKSRRLLVQTTFDTQNALVGILDIELGENNARAKPSQRSQGP